MDSMDEIVKEFLVERYENFDQLDQDPPLGSNHVAKPQPLSAEPPTAEFNSPERGSAVSDSSVRLEVHLLVKLINPVGELVLARNQIFQFGQSSDDPSVVAAFQRLNLITTELREGVMKTRMPPIRNIWNKIPRVVRDLAQSCGKEVQVRMDGALSRTQEPAHVFGRRSNTPLRCPPLPFPRSEFP